MNDGQYYLIFIDPEGIITTAMMTNLVPEGAIEVSEAVYRAAASKTNRARWIDGEIIDIPEPPPPPAPIPKVTKRQLRLWLLRKMGKTLDDVRAILQATLSGSVLEEALIELDDASEYERQHPLFTIVGPAFEMTPTDIDQAFIEAATY